MRRLAILTGGLAIALTAFGPGGAGAQVQVPPGWGMVGDEAVRYFVFNSDMGKVVRRDLIDSKSKGPTTERRNEVVTPKVRIPGTGTDSELPTETKRYVDKPADLRLEDPNLNTYKVWRIDTIRVVQTRTPYKDYRVTDYERRTRSTFLNTYATDTLYSWNDPITGETLTHTVRLVEEPIEEYTFSDWTPGQDRVEIGSGTETTVRRTVIASRTEDQLLSSTRATGGQGLYETGRSVRSYTLVTDASKGSRAAGQASSGKAIDLSGAGKAAARGGAAIETALKRIAAKGATLYDDGGSAAWQLGLSRGQLAFTPIDAAGKAHPESTLVVADGLLPANGKDGSKIHIREAAVGRGGSVALSGDFRNALLGGKGRGSTTLVTH